MSTYIAAEIRNQVREDFGNRRGYCLNSEKVSGSNMIAGIPTYTLNVGSSQRTRRLDEPSRYRCGKSREEVSRKVVLKAPGHLHWAF